MTKAFDRWLGKPSTLRYLRHLLYPSTRPRRSVLPLPVDRPYGCAKRCVATAALKVKSHENGVEPKEVVTSDKSQNGLHLSESASRVVVRTDETLLANMMNGTETFLNSKHQCDVNNPKLFATLLVDQEGQKDNHALWTEIVRFRRRVDGFEGVLDVWDGMRMRNCNSPNFEPESDALWAEFIQATLYGRNEQTPAKLRLADEIVDYAKKVRARTRAKPERLYKAIVGAWMPFRPGKALHWHHKLVGAGFVYPGAIASLGPLAIKTEPASNAFKHIYEQSTDRDMYDSFMTEVLEMSKDSAALAWHRFFLSHGDEPSGKMSAKPEVQRFFDMEKGKPPASSYSGRLQGVNSDVSSHSMIPPISRASMNTIVGDVHGIKARQISDGFCAKLLATRAFSLQIVLNGISFLGVTALGPLATHELARCAKSPAAFIDIKADLDSRGIEIATHVFSQLILRVASIGNPALWTQILELDQHPDTFSDSALLERLLSEFLSQEQWVKAHLTLLALSLGSSSGHQLAWNRMLNHYARTGQHESLLNTMETIRDQKLPLTEFTLSSLFRSVLPPRQKGKTHVKTRDSESWDPLSFVTNALIYGAERASPERGSYVQYRMWIELLKRHGMEGRWHDLKRIVLWLVNWYSEDNVLLQIPEGADLPSPAVVRNPADIPRLVLDHYMVKAIFVWGFRYASRRKKLRELNHGHRNDETALIRHQRVELWACGLELLRILWERGIPINEHDVEQAFILRMWILFGPGWSTIGMNNEARRCNELSLEHYIRHANKVWPGIIRGVEPHLLDEAANNRAELLVRLFGRARMTSRIRGEFVNVEAWAKELSTRGNDRIQEPYGTSAKQDLWERSRFRHTLPKVTAVTPNATKLDKLTLINSKATAFDPAQEADPPSGAYQPMG